MTGHKTKTTLKVVTVVSIVLLGTLAFVPQGTQGQTSLSLGEFSISNKGIDSQDGVLSDIFISTNLSYSWQSTHQPDVVRFELDVGDGSGNWDTIASKAVQSNITRNETGVMSLNGSVFDSFYYSSFDFRVSEPGNRTQQSISLRASVEFLIDGTVEKRKSVETSVIVVVNYEQQQLSVSISVGADGNVILVD